MLVVLEGMHRAAYSCPPCLSRLTLVLITLVLGLLPVKELGQAVFE